MLIVKKICFCLLLVLLVTLSLSVIMFSFYCLLARLTPFFSSSTAFSIVCRGDLVDMNYFSLFVTWKVFLFPSVITDDFFQYRGQVCHSVPLKYRVRAPGPLAIKVFMKVICYSDVFDFTFDLISFFS